jgi:hypothetical protein
MGSGGLAGFDFQARRSCTSTVCRLPCKSLSREKTLLLRRATEERAKANIFRTRSPQRVPLGGGSCLRRTGHPFTVSGPEGPSQKIEFGFSASPETTRREPPEFDLLRSVGKRQDLAACALCNPVNSFSAVLSRCAAVFCRYKLAFPPIHGKQIGHHLPGYGQRRSVSVPLLLFLFMDQGQLMVLSGS